MELPQAVSLVVGGLLLPLAIPGFLDRMAKAWAGAISPETIAEPGTAMRLLGTMLWEAFALFVPLTAAIVMASVVSQFALAGKPNPHRLRPRWTNISPKAGVKRIFSTRQLWELGRNVVKLALLVGVTYGVWSAGMRTMTSGPAPVGTNLERVGSSVQELFVRVAALGLVVGVADAVYSRRKFDKDLKMSKHDVKQEHKQQEGSPLVKQQIRRRQLAMSRNRMIAEVGRAAVVVTNPTHLAVALAYSPDDPAPRVVAKGAGRVADRIRQEARAHGVPIREDKPLARTLFRTVDLGATIPVELYAAVATVLAAVFRARNRRGARPVRPPRVATAV